MAWFGDEEWHGTNTGYTNYECRCPRCKKARSEYRAEARRKKLIEVASRADRDGRGQSIQHGKEANYTSGRCLCSACKGAATDARRRRRKEKLEREQQEARRRIDEQWEGF